MHIYLFKTTKGDGEKYSGDSPPGDNPKCETKDLSSPDDFEIFFSVGNVFRALQLRYG